MACSLDAMTSPTRHTKMWVVREPAAGTPEVVTPRMGVALTRLPDQSNVAYDCGGCGGTLFLDASSNSMHGRFIYRCANCGAYNQLYPPKDSDNLRIDQA
jgi:hypothetical protein